MSGIDLITAEHHLQAWLDADLAVATGQSYSIGSRQLTRADSADIRSNIKYWTDIVNTLTRGSGFKIKQAVPR